MASIKQITLFGTNYDVMDETARTTAESAETKAAQATTTANQAAEAAEAVETKVNQAVATAESADTKADQAIAALQNATSVSYSSGTEALVFTKGVSK